MSTRPRSLVLVIALKLGALLAVTSLAACASQTICDYVTCVVDDGDTAGSGGAAGTGGGGGAGGSGGAP